jgi:hypothetical protein
MSNRGEHELLLRLLADSERWAAEGYFREAVVLLRWASRIATRDRLPLVLLSYHRILGVERSRGEREQGVEIGCPSVQLPRFPEVAPMVERNAFLPAHEVARPPRRDSVAANGPPQARRPRSDVGWIALIGVCSALLLVRQPDGLSDAQLGRSSETNERSELEPRPTPGFVLTSARESLVRGDSTRARAQLRQVLEDPRTSIAEYADAAALLMRLDALKAPTMP